MGKIIKLLKHSMIIIIIFLIAQSFLYLFETNNTPNKSLGEVSKEYQKSVEKKQINELYELFNEYESPLVIEDGDYLLALVNKQTTLSNYRPTDLVEIEPKMVGANGPHYLREEANYHLYKMWRDAKAQGISLYVVSSYRSYEVQKTIFNRNVSSRGEREANRFSARPGESEHQLGTTVDFIGGIGEGLTESFAHTPAGKWLKLNSYKYGFAMSYPEGKEHITGYIFEPWHYRYIGVEAAKEWRESGLTLTEFLMTKPQYFKEKKEFVRK